MPVSEGWRTTFELAYLSARTRFLLACYTISLLDTRRLHVDGARLTSSLFKVLNIVLEEKILSVSRTPDAREVGVTMPSSVNLEQVIELRLVITTPTRAVDLLHGCSGREDHLVRGYPDDRPILLVQLVDISRPVCVELMPLQRPGGE